MDNARLADIVQPKDRQAFAALVSQHIDWVYCAAARQVGDHHLAEDITQAVFLLLAGKAADMPKDTKLGGWLFRAVRYASSNALKVKRRREYHERRAQVPERGARGEWWERVAPVLDEMVARLSRRDRELVIARFYQGKTLEELAKESGMSADGVRKRLGRVMEQLREMLRTRAGELPEEMDGMLARGMAGVAPAGLAAAVAEAAKTGASSAAVSGLSAGVAKGFAAAKMKIAVGVAAGLVVVGGLGVVGVKLVKGEAGSRQAGERPVVAPAAKAVTGWQEIAMTAGREDAVYLAFGMLVDQMTMDGLRKVCTPAGDGAQGYELLTGDSEAVRQILREHDGGGAVGLERVQARQDSMELVRGYGFPSRVEAAADLPVAGTRYRVSSDISWSACMSQRKVQVVLDGRTAARTYGQVGAGTAPQMATATLRTSATFAVNGCLLVAMTAAADGTKPWTWLMVVQSYGAEQADVEGLAASVGTGQADGEMPVSSWLSKDSGKWLMDARRSALWSAHLPKVDDGKWARTLADRSELRIVQMSDDRVSPALAWSPGGGWTKGYRIRSQGNLRATVAGGGQGGQEFPLRDGQTTLRVGVGEGQFEQVGTLEAKPGAAVTIGGRRYGIVEKESPSPVRVWYDNDPAVDVMFKAINADGRPSGIRVEPQIWPVESETLKRGEGYVHVIEPSSKVGILMRKRVWHTFEGFAVRPVAPPPSDAEIMASFTKPLELPPQGDSGRDRFAAAKAQLIAADIDAAGTKMRYVADATGKWRMESDKGSVICDGERCIFDVNGTMFVSRYGLPSPRIVPASQSGILDALTSIERTLSGVKLVGEENLAGVAAKVFEGTSSDEMTRTWGQVVRLWRDSQGRLLQMKIGNLGSVALRYDSPDDAQFLAIPEADLAKAQDADRALPVLDKLTARPAVLEMRNADRVVKVHEVLAGENGDIYVGYSVQLTPEAAKVLRFASEGESWGRGFVELSRDEKMRQYHAAHVAFIHERDRSLWWVVLTPAAAKSEQPWMMKLCLFPAGSPSGIDLLRRQGLGGFRVMQFPLPPADASKKVSLNAWLKEVHAQVGEYSKVAALQSYENVQPVAGKVDGFVESAKATVEAARRGGSQGLTAD